MIGFTLVRLCYMGHNRHTCCCQLRNHEFQPPPLAKRHSWRAKLYKGKEVAEIQATFLIIVIPLQLSLTDIELQNYEDQNFTGYQQVIGHKGRTSLSHTDSNVSAINLKQGKLIYYCQILKGTSKHCTLLHQLSRLSFKSYKQLQQLTGDNYLFL